MSRSRRRCVRSHPTRPRSCPRHLPRTARPIPAPGNSAPPRELTCRVRQLEDPPAVKMRQAMLASLALAALAAHDALGCGDPGGNSCAGNRRCPRGEFCNYDDGDRGFCEGCS